MQNYFTPYNWETILSLYPPYPQETLKTLIQDYHRILSPEMPDFLQEYINLPVLQRLKGIGLLCGTDWTKLYKNRFYYSRLDHSVGTALIIWHFTKDKAQTLAGLLHDVSTPVFSHVSDFRKGDALTQTATEAENITIIRQDKELAALLKRDGISVKAVEDYHVYPVADNEIPQLSADRLEYMFPSGMALEGSWTLPEIKQVYGSLSVLKNEDGIDELGFRDKETAAFYCRKFCMTSHLLQLNENKLTLHLLGQVMNLAVKEQILSEQDFMTMSEEDLLKKLEEGLSHTENSENENADRLFCRRLYKTFRNMEKIEHTEKPLPPDTHFSISLKVKQRYINPLVLQGSRTYRLTEIHHESAEIIRDFLSWNDTEYGCVKYI